MMLSKDHRKALLEELLDAVSEERVAINLSAEQLSPHTDIDLFLVRERIELIKKCLVEDELENF